MRKEIFLENLPRLESGANKGKIITQETKQKLREDTSNRRWINNGIIEKYVCKEQIDSFLENDWSKGRIYRRKNKND